MQTIKNSPLDIFSGEFFYVASRPGLFVLGSKVQEKHHIVPLHKAIDKLPDLLRQALIGRLQLRQRNLVTAERGRLLHQYKSIESLH